jgi:hypothetical protein
MRSSFWSSPCTLVGHLVAYLSLVRICTWGTSAPFPPPSCTHRPQTIHLASICQADSASLTASLKVDRFPKNKPKNPHQEQNKQTSKAVNAFLPRQPAEGLDSLSPPCMVQALCGPYRRHIKLARKPHFHPTLHPHIHSSDAQGSNSCYKLNMPLSSLPGFHCYLTPL